MSYEYQNILQTNEAIGKDFDICQTDWQQLH